MLALLSAGQLAKLQAYHCGLLRLLFLSDTDPSARSVVVTMAVVHDTVKVSLSPQRLVRPLGGQTLDDSVGRLLEVIMEDYWNFKAPAATGGAEGGNGGEKSGAVGATQVRRHQMASRIA